MKDKDNENYVDGTECVKEAWTDKDFMQADEYKEGPTDYTGGGKNEKHS